MTMKPRAKKFRIRRGSLSLPQPQETKDDTAIDRISQTDDGFGDQVFPTAARADVPVKSEHEQIDSPAEAIAAIRREGLTGRQLRMARRVAQKYGLKPSSDYDAVYLLRRKGIDPFQRSNLLELVSESDTARQNLPQPVHPPSVPVPPGDKTDEEIRAAEIRRIQQDIARRRRRSLFSLLTRLVFFVGLPTAIAGYYFSEIATPLYATHTEFVIQQAEAQNQSQFGGLFSGTGFATSQDSITVQSYLTSRDAMTRLDGDLGFKAHFQQENIDPVQRLGVAATNEDAYKLYKRHVKIGYDPSEGLIRMEVIAAAPEISVAFSDALISYAEEQVDNLTQRLREDQMSGARNSYEEAEQKMRIAQLRVIELQEARGVLSADAEGSLLMGQISQFESELSTERLRRDELLANLNPNQTRLSVSEGRIRRLEAMIAEKRAELTEGGESGQSLARITGELMVAQADLETRQVMLQQALQQMENARIEANRQVRYLSLAVRPVAPDKATYPRVFENTALAFLIFAGLYLMASLTASILREQVSS